MPASVPSCLVSGTLGQALPPRLGEEAALDIGLNLPEGHWGHPAWLLPAPGQRPGRPLGTLTPCNFM